MNWSPFTAFLTCLVICLLEQDALAARGGSSRGGRSSSSRSSRYSKSGSRSYSSVSSLVYSGFSWTVKYRSFHYGYYLNSLTWRQSHGDFSDSTRICFNILDALPSEYNSSVQVPWIYQNRTTYGIFVCPLDGRSDKTFCCGDDGAERCCTFWDGGNRVVAVVLSLIAVVVVVIIVAVKLGKSAKTPSCTNSVSISDADMRSMHQKGDEDLPPPYPGPEEADNSFSNRYHSNNYSNSYGNEVGSTEDKSATLQQ